MDFFWRKSPPEVCISVKSEIEFEFESDPEYDIIENQIEADIWIKGEPEADVGMKNEPESDVEIKMEFETALETDLEFGVGTKSDDSLVRIFIVK